MKTCTSLLVLTVVVAFAAAAAGGKGGSGGGSGGGGGGGGGAGGGGGGGSGGGSGCKRPEVRVRQGKLRGEWLTTVRQKLQFASFRGIPFATPPIGPLRFKDPRPARRWTGILEATTFGGECLQLEGNETKGQEDCLYLNVYVPPGTQLKTDRLPVLVYFPGGAFVRGSSNRYGADYFMEAGGALVVVVNYRLGVFGFFHLGTADIPGNAGLKDQNLALRWVQDNIAAFGGDPARVTIFGQSAGGVSVHGHVLSPMSAGLFSQAISISGSMLASWAIPRNPTLQRRRLLERAGCDKPRPEEVAACMRAEPANDLVRAAGTVDLMREMLRDQQIPFTPVVDGRVPGATPFLPDRPQALVKTGRFNRVPHCHGITDGELLFFMASAPANTPAYVESGLTNITREFKDKVQESLPDGLPMNVSDVAKKVYLPSSSKGQDVLEKLVEAGNDLFFVWPAVLAARSQSVFEPRQYLYYFSLDARLDMRKPTLQPFLKVLPGVPHGGDLFYMFRTPEGINKLSEDSLEMKTLRAYVQLVLNLAITGQPTPQPVEGTLWPPYSSDKDGAYLNFGSDLLTVQKGLRKVQMMVWDFVNLLVSLRR